MAVGTNYWKIGLFVILGGAALVALLLVVGAKSWNKETVQYVTYFDESVQGLEIGAPVKYRGVTIGAVELVNMASDRQLVSVQMAMDVNTTGGLLDGAAHVGGSVVRTQLAQAGLTGQRFVLIDLFDAAKHPERPLPFPVPEHYVPSVPSTLAQIENAVVQTSDQLPMIAERAAHTLEKIDATIASIDQAQVTRKAGFRRGRRAANAGAHSFGSRARGHSRNQQRIPGYLASNDQNTGDDGSHLAARQCQKRSVVLD